MRIRIATLGVLAGTLGLAACGGGQRQDVTEPSGTFPVDVEKASFPPHQRLAEAKDLELKIRNTGQETVPDLAVTIYTTGESSQGRADGSFNIRIDNPAFSNPNRPVWILENKYPKLRPPGVSLSQLARQPAAGAVAAQTDTFQFGPLPPGQSKDIVWHVTPVKAGTYKVHYEVAAGLQGKAKAVGSNVNGHLPVTISPKAPQTCVNAAGQVVQGRCQFK